MAVFDNLANMGEIRAEMDNIQTQLNDITSDRKLKTYTNVTQLGLTQDNTLDEVFSALSSGSRLVMATSAGKNLNGSLPASDAALLVVDKGNSERGTATWTKFSSRSTYINSCWKSAWTGWETLATQAGLDEKLAKSGGTLTGKLTTQQVENSTSYVIGADKNSYSTAPFVASAPYNSNTASRAGYGFHNHGLNGTFLYLETNGDLKKADNDGTFHKIMDSGHFSVSGTTLNITL